MIFSLFYLQIYFIKSKFHNFWKTQSILYNQKYLQVYLGQKFCQNLGHYKILFVISSISQFMYNTIDFTIFFDPHENVKQKDKIHFYHHFYHHFYKSCLIPLTPNLQSQKADMETDVKLHPIAIHPKAYRYFPKFQEEKNLRGKKGIRFYFFGQVQHDDYQKEKLKYFYDYLQRKNKKFNANLYPNDHYVLHILWANQFRNQQTFECMENYTKFRLQTVPSLQLNRFEQILRSGFYYISGRDKLFRPIIIFKVNAMDPDNMEPYIQAAIYSFEQVLNNLLLPGQVENWYIIYDLEGINNIWDLPYTAIKKVIASVSMNYACRLQKSFIFNAPGIMGFFWKIFSTFMDSYTASKFVITSENTDKTLFQDINPSQIEVKYGGTQPNRIEYFPFKIPEARVDESKLVNDVEYEQMLKSGKLRRNRIDPKFLAR